MARPLVLIVEDECSIAEVQRAYFQRAGFAVEHLESGAGAADFVHSRDVTLVLLDLMLPDIDGIDVCKAIRRFSDVPIIMVTAKVDEIDRLIGLEIGADDYVCKPFSARELVARAKAILRRVPAAGTASLSCGKLKVNLDERSASIDGEPLELTRREFQLLVILAQRAERVLSREQIIAHLYDDPGISDRSVDSHIKNLRKKLSAADAKEKWIRTEYGQGYRFRP